MKNPLKTSLVLKLFLAVATAFIVIFFSAKFFLFPEVSTKQNIIRFFLCSVTALIFMGVMVCYLVYADILIPEDKILKELKGSAEDEIKSDPSFNGYGILKDAGDALRQFKSHARKKIEKLQYSHSYLRAVFLNMFDGVMVIDTEGNIMLMNESLHRFLGTKANERGKKPIEIIRNARIQEIVEKVIRMKKGVLTEEIIMLLPEKRYFLIHATPLIRKDVREGAVLVFHEITALRKFEQMRKDFVANVSHELRTPISNIKGYVETLLGGAMEDKENAEEFLQVIQSESDRLVNLIGDLLDISKLESGELGLEISTWDLDEIVSDVIDKLESKSFKKQMVLENKVSSDIRIKADKAFLSQVLFNLVDNAIKYVQTGGRVVLSAFNKDHLVEVHVSDNGPGIPQESASRIFERFYRLDKARSREMGGTGLGLSIAKHIVQEHGGDIWVESEYGEGSTFCFTIPKA